VTNTEQTSIDIKPALATRKAALWQLSVQHATSTAQWLGVCDSRSASDEEADKEEREVVGTDLAAIVAAAIVAAATPSLPGNPPDLQSLGARAERKSARQRATGVR